MKKPAGIWETSISGDGQRNLSPQAGFMGTVTTRPGIVNESSENTYTESWKSPLATSPAQAYKINMSIFDSPIVLDVPDAAEALDLSHDQVRWLLRSKALFGRKIGKYWITTRKAVDE